MHMETTRCRGTRRDGSPCQAPPHTVNAAGWCWAHDPANAGRRREAQARGGRNRAAAARAEKLVPVILRPVLDTLLDAVGEVRGGTLTPQQAGALASLAGAIVRVFTAGTLEERVAALEAEAQREAEARGTA